MDRLKVFIHPFFRGEDKGDGGVRRVIEAQNKYLPQFGIEVVKEPAEADLFAIHMTDGSFLTKKFPGTPVVAHCHGLYWDSDGIGNAYNWDKWAYKANEDVMGLIRVADATTAPSEWVANSIRRNASRPVTVIHHGVDMADWASDETNDNYILWNKTRPDPVCDPAPLNGVAKLLPELKFVSTFGDEAPNVLLTGRLPYEEAKIAVQKAGVYLATSKETFGIGTLEAMAAGVPVVGYAWGGQPDIVRDKLDGFLVDPGDIFSLALAIQGALQDRSLLSANAKERAAQFTWESAVQQYAQLYTDTFDRAVASRAAPKVSILVTNHNLEQYLPACLDSVLAQSDPDWECIIVDDASTNAEAWPVVTAQVARDNRIRAVGNVKNVYLAEARNVGIRLANGRYILPLDADDMLAPDAVALLSSALDADRTIQVAYGNVRFVGLDGVTPEVYEGYEKSPGYSSWPWEFKFEDQMKQRNLLPYSSMYRREAWQNTGGYRPRCRTAEDADFWARLSSYGFRPKMVTTEPTLIYRVRKDSMSHVEKPAEWIKWFPWSKNPGITPAGALTAAQMPVASLDNPKVSVIIPCGPNHRTLVKDAIDSVDAQFFRDWECIVINDSGKPLDELPQWVRIIETGDSPVGVAAARNLGIAAASAPLFLPLDADDYLQPNALQWMVEAYNQSHDIIFSDMWEDPHTEGQFKVYEYRDYDPTRLTHGMLHAVTALTPKSVWQQVGGYDEKIPAWEDWDFQLKCADAGFCSRRLVAPVWVYRKHTGQRREENVANFEESKKGILSKWQDVWNGRPLMACSSCSQRASIRPSSPLAQRQTTAVATRQGQDAVIIQYTGTKRGNMQFKGKSGTYYIFSAGDQKYVLSQDAPFFLTRPDFQVIARDAMTAREAGTPVLVAEGKPV